MKYEKLETLCSKVTDGTHDSPKPVDFGIPFIMGLHVKEGRVDFEKCLFLPQSEHEKIIKRSKPENGDTLMANIGANVGSTGYVNVDFEFSIKNVALFKPSGKIHGRYLFYLLSSPYEQAVLKNKISGAAQPFLSLEILRNHKINYHESYATQRRIASILSAYDDLIENNLKRIKLLEEIAKRTYEEWFVKFRVNGEQLTIDEKTGLPVGWERKRADEVADITMGQSPKSEYYNKEGKGLPFHQGVSDYGFRFPQNTSWSLQGNRFAKEGDILFSVRAPVGRLNIAIEKIILGRGLSAISHKKKLTNGLFYQLQNIFFKEDIIGGGAIFNSVTKNEIERIPIILCDQVTESNFDLLVSNFNSQIKLLSIQNQKLKESRDILLPKLMNGTINID